MREAEAREQKSVARAADGASSLGSILEAFGPAAELKTGACLAKDVIFERLPARLAAELRDGGTLVARLVRDQSVVWEGETDLAEVAKWEQLSARIARERAAAPATAPNASEQPSRAWGAKEEALARGLLPPIVGETWVMDVRIED